MRRLMPLFAFAVLLVVGSTACTHAPRYDEPGSNRHDYYYYPHAGVYFHLHSGQYYYRDGGSWVRVRALPQRIYLDHRARRTLVIADAEPYRSHKVHRERYRRSIWTGRMTGPNAIIIAGNMANIASGQSA